jgi:hypothetical protein
MDISEIAKENERESPIIREIIMSKCFCVKTYGDDHDQNKLRRNSSGKIARNTEKQRFLQ